MVRFGGVESGEDSREPGEGSIEEGRTMEDHEASAARRLGGGACGLKGECLV